MKNPAKVMVNGKPLGIVRHAPYMVDATSTLRPGANKVTIHVSNAWVNRLIGNQQPDTKTRFRFADVKPYNTTRHCFLRDFLGRCV